MITDPIKLRRFRIRFLSHGKERELEMAIAGGTGSAIDVIYYFTAKEVEREPTWRFLSFDSLDTEFVFVGPKELSIIRLELERRRNEKKTKIEAHLASKFSEPRVRPSVVEMAQECAALQQESACTSE